MRVGLPLMSGGHLGGAGPAEPARPGAGQAHAAGSALKEETRLNCGDLGPCLVVKSGQKMVIALVSQDCHYKVAQAEGLRRQTCVLPVLESGSPMDGAPSPGSRRGSLLASSNFCWLPAIAAASCHVSALLHPLRGPPT